MKMDIVTAMRIGLASPFLVERWMRLHGDPWKKHNDQIRTFFGVFLVPACMWGLITWSYYEPGKGLYGLPIGFHIVLLATLGAILTLWFWVQRKNNCTEQDFIKACKRLQEITGPYHQKNVGLLGETELADAARRYLVHLAKNKLLIERNDGPMREEEEKRHGLIFKEAWNFLYYKFVLVENGFESYYDEAERQLQAVLKDAPQIVGPPADPAAAAAN